MNPEAPLVDCLKVSSVFVVKDDENSDDLLELLANHVTITIVMYLT